jgi:enterochelin esterase-like enzyme
LRWRFPSREQPVAYALVIALTMMMLPGETFQLPSEILGERRAINVYLPPSCSEAAARCPVLYMPDGGMDEDFLHILGSLDVSIRNQIIRPIILVGIPNTERRRDLVGPTTVPEEQKAAPHAGGAQRFRQFLRDELKPAIAARYRVSSESAIVGESLRDPAGLRGAASAIRIGWFADPWSVAQGGTGARLRQRLRNRFPGLF